MCGIIGILGRAPVAPLLVDALKRLEYRGYDSAGVATLEEGRLTRRRAEGKLVNLERRLADAPLQGTSGIGHTRWATHGPPTENNAHPHATERVAVVHNGIIENFQELRQEIEASGRTLETDTDTEVVAHLISAALDRQLTPVEAMRETLGKLKGAFALAVLIEGDEDLMLAARQGSPLAIGHGDGEMFIGSDAIALAPFTDRITYLEEGDWAVLTRDSVVIFDAAGHTVERPAQTAVGTAFTVDKGRFRHFMAKEIHEQPEVVGHTIEHYIDAEREAVRLPEGFDVDLTQVRRISLVACGTAYIAGSIARYWLERIAGVPVEVDIASEFRYRGSPMSPDTLGIFVSQSGETADTLASLRHMTRAGLRTVAVVNVPTSSIAREAGGVLPTLAGPEIGVASTKAFTCQLAVLQLFTIALARAHGVIDAEGEARLVRAVRRAPALINQALHLDDRMTGLARMLSRATNALYLGRDTNFPLALEGALKLKEISYIHAEGYAAGELKHGPIALVDEDMPVIVIAPHDGIFEKTVSNMQEVAARGGRIILITDSKGANAAGLQPEEVITMPEMEPEIVPLVYSVPIQLMAYHTAVFMGTDVDQPRNLAKSVTVE